MQVNIQNDPGINGVNGINIVKWVNREVKFHPIQKLTLQKNQLKSFPLDCLPDVLKDYADSVSKSTQTHIDMAAVSVLSAVSIAAQGKYEVSDSGNHREMVNLYTAIFANPGERKSGVLKCCAETLMNYDMMQKDRHFIFDDCTSEAMTEKMEQNGGIGAVISAEGGIFDILAGRYSQKPNLDIWLKGHPGDFLKIDRKREKPIIIPRPVLSTLLTVQPSILEDIMTNSTMQGRGLIARFLFAFPKSMVGKRSYFHPKMSEKAKERYDSLLLELLGMDVESEPIILRFSQMCDEILDTYFLKTEEYVMEAASSFSEWCAKYFGAVVRIAGVLHIAENREIPEISVDTFKKAIEIGEYFKNQAEYAFSLMGEDMMVSSAKLVIRKLKETPDSLRGMKSYQIYKLCRGSLFHKAEDIKPVLEFLEERGWITMVSEDRQGPGRKPDDMVYFNPEAFDKEP